MYSKGDLDAAYCAYLPHRGVAQNAGEDDPELLPPAGRQMLMGLDLRPGAPDEVTMGARDRAGVAGGRVARALTGGRCPRRVAVLFCREADTYVSDAASERRARVRDELARVLELRRARVLVAHSLGSVVAYEAPWHRPFELDLLVTLGSALGAAGTCRLVSRGSTCAER